MGLSRKSWDLFFIQFSKRLSMKFTCNVGIYAVRSSFIFSTFLCNNQLCDTFLHAFKLIIVVVKFVLALGLLDSFWISTDGNDDRRYIGKYQISIVLFALPTKLAKGAEESSWIVFFYMNIFLSRIILNLVILTAVRFFGKKIFCLISPNESEGAFPFLIFFFETISKMNSLF